MKRGIECCLFCRQKIKADVIYTAVQAGEVRTKFPDAAWEFAGLAARDELAVCDGCLHVLDRFKYACGYCGAAIDKQAFPRNKDVDCPYCGACNYRPD